MIIKLELIFLCVNIHHVNTMKKNVLRITREDNLHMTAKLFSCKRFDIKTGIYFSQINEIILKLHVFYAIIILNSMLDGDFTMLVRYEKIEKNYK